MQFQFQGKVPCLRSANAVSVIGKRRSEGGSLSSETFHLQFARKRNETYLETGTKPLRGVTIEHTVTGITRLPVESEI